jgi:hypothetical protein
VGFKCPDDLKIVIGGGCTLLFGGRGIGTLGAKFDNVDNDDKS